MALLIALLFVPSFSSFIKVGPRISKVTGEDFGKLHLLAKTNKNGIPYVAIILQSIITVVLILTAQFESVLTFIGFSLSLFTFLTVCGIFIIRSRGMHKKLTYKTFGYPEIPIFYLALNAWMLYFTVTNKPMESLYGLINVAVGAIVLVAREKKT